MPQILSSQIEVVGKKRVSQENLEAIRARFLEMLIHKTPKQNPSDLEQCGTFERQHFIYGSMDRVLSTLEKYEASDFYNLYLPAYVLSGLSKNIDAMEADICGQCQLNHRQRIDQLKLKYNINV